MRTKSAVFSVVSRTSRAALPSWGSSNAPLASRTSDPEVSREKTACVFSSRAVFYDQETPIEWKGLPGIPHEDIEPLPGGPAQAPPVAAPPPVQDTPPDPPASAQVSPKPNPTFRPPTARPTPSPTFRPPGKPDNSDD